MPRFAWTCVVALSCLGACAARVEQKEDMLAAAGFSFRAADTPAKVAAMKALPAHRFVHQVRGGRDVWIYADPSICGCVYAGDQAAWRRYQGEVFQKRIADEQLQAARANADAVMDQDATMMSWDVWGPWAPYYGP